MDQQAAASSSCPPSGSETQQEEQQEDEMPFRLDHAGRAVPILLEQEEQQKLSIGENDGAQQTTSFTSQSVSPVVDDIRRDASESRVSTMKNVTVGSGDSSARQRTAAKSTVTQAPKQPAASSKRRPSQRTFFKARKAKDRKRSSPKTVSESFTDKPQKLSATRAPSSLARASAKPGESTSTTSPPPADADFHRPLDQETPIRKEPRHIPLVSSLKKKQPAESEATTPESTQKTVRFNDKDESDSSLLQNHKGPTYAENDGNPENSLGGSQNIQNESLGLRQGLSRSLSDACLNLFGNDYSKREGAFVLLAGALIAFNSGFVNGSCLSGLLIPNRQQSVAGFSTTYTKSGLALADGDTSKAAYFFYIVLSYMFGSFLSGLITPRGTPYQIEPTYGPTFMVGGWFLMAASLLSAFEYNPDYVFFLAAAANGVQNGIASIYSSNLIRCSLDGNSTDVALVAGQVLRGNNVKAWTGMVLFMIIFNFWLGSFLSFFLTRRFLSYTLFFNATLFWC